jgi:hypothetical protein
MAWSVAVLRNVRVHIAVHRLVVGTADTGVLDVKSGLSLIQDPAVTLKAHQHETEARMSRPERHGLILDLKTWAWRWNAQLPTLVTGSIDGGLEELRRMNSDSPGTQAHYCLSYECLGEVSRWSSLKQPRWTAVAAAAQDLIALEGSILGKQPGEPRR